MSAMSPFDIINELANGSAALMYDDAGNVNSQALSAYTPYLTNRAFSMYLSSIFESQYMNRMPWLPKLMQYDFYRNGLRQGSRRRKRWPKPDVVDLEMLAKTYQCSMPRAREIRSVLTPAQLKALAQKQEKGGVKK